MFEHSSLFFVGVMIHCSLLRTCRVRVEEKEEFLVYTVLRPLTRHPYLESASALSDIHYYASTCHNLYHGRKTSCIFFLASVQLSPNTSSSGICPQVTFNCTAVDLPSTTLRWFINDDIIAAYPYDPDHQFPYNETLVSSPWREVVMIQIMNASYSVSNRDRGNFYSTLTANLSALVILGGNDISCGSTGTKSAIALNFQYIGKIN